MPERAGRHAGGLRELPDEVLGALISAYFGDLGDGAGRVFQTVFRKFNARIDDIVDRTDAEGLLVEGLEPGSAEIQAAEHRVDVPVELGVEHHVAAQGDQLVVVRFVQNINVAVREFCEEDAEQAQHLGVIGALVGIALPRDELKKVMHKIRVGGREGNVRDGETLNEILIGVEPDPVVLVGFAGQGTVVFAVAGSK